MVNMMLTLSSQKGNTSVYKMITHGKHNADIVFTER